MRNRYDARVRRHPQGDAVTNEYQKEAAHHLPEREKRTGAQKEHPRHETRHRCAQGRRGFLASQSRQRLAQRIVDSNARHSKKRRQEEMKLFRHNPTLVERQDDVRVRYFKVRLAGLLAASVNERTKEAR
ncbi:hypothetical protein MRX96_020048 [Rhipicephalus microplus]